ncbi:B-cell receptor CD22-like isoform X2 [Eleginops maclovinus]|uniref:B-cell receptor CD22-like isoform X2 n=1 Tax=Eleginops maclovinus TaxID=56733 RepID=UPI0030807527
MARRDESLLLCFMLLLPGAAGLLVVNHPGPVCGVKGSTLTLPCTFSTLKSVSEGGREVLVKIQRVVWCQNHAICQGSTPSVYDSESERRSNPRYRYLGDKEGNCTLQITDLQETDDATLRFRVEADHSSATFTGLPGVRVTVRDGIPMQIKNSSEADALLCTALCTFHHLEVTWFRDGHALPQSGPSLRLSALTAKDSGNYTCALKDDPRTTSLPYSLQVEAAGGGGGHLLPLIVSVVGGVLLAVALLLFCILRRRRAAAGGGEEEQKSGGAGGGGGHRLQLSGR